jgi:ankyrin repeat protein
LNAVLANDVEAFKYLVSCGADPMQELPAGYLLNDACAMGFVEMAKELLRLGVEIDAQNAAGQTALAQAVAFEYLDLVRLLLKSGASPHAGGPEATAVHWATEFGSPEMKKLLGIKPKK